MRPSVGTVDKSILVICGCGLAASIVAISRLSTWPIVMEEDHSGEADFTKTKAAFIIGLMASAASLGIGIVRMRLDILCLLVTVAVWGDFINHGERNALHRNVLPWSYWVAVAAAVLQFLAFLLYIIRSDFKDSPGAAAAGGAATATLAGAGGSRQLQSFTADAHDDNAEAGGRVFV
uniref:Transmembrane protein n=1 Tax=Macrostomum lignano TaxID=282301 RepID=A0A1I8GL99_9PLAT